MSGIAFLLPKVVYRALINFISFLTGSLDLYLHQSFFPLLEQEVLISISGISKANFVWSLFSRTS